MQFLLLLVKKKKKKLTNCFYSMKFLHYFTFPLYVSNCVSSDIYALN